jgi:hypothetical protein
MGKESGDVSALEIADPSQLTDAHWAEINNLRRCYKEGGPAALSKALDDLQKRDTIMFVQVMAALFPHKVGEAIRDAMAEIGMTKDELRELIRNDESPARRDQ